MVTFLLFLGIMLPSGDIQSLYDFRLTMTPMQVYESLVSCNCDIGTPAECDDKTLGFPFDCPNMVGTVFSSPEKPIATIWIATHHLDEDGQIRPYRLWDGGGSWN